MPTPRSRSTEILPGRGHNTEHHGQAADPWQEHLAGVLKRGIPSPLGYEGEGHKNDDGSIQKGYSDTEITDFRANIRQLQAIRNKRVAAAEKVKKAAESVAEKEEMDKVIAEAEEIFKRQVIVETINLKRKYFWPLTPLEAEYDKRETKRETAEQHLQGQRVVFVHEFSGPNAKQHTVKYTETDNDENYDDENYKENEDPSFTDTGQKRLFKFLRKKVKNPSYSQTKYLGIVHGKIVGLQEANNRLVNIVVEDEDTKEHVTFPTMEDLDKELVRGNPMEQQFVEAAHEQKKSGYVVLLEALRNKQEALHMQEIQTEEVRVIIGLVMAALDAAELNLTALQKNMLEEGVLVEMKKRGLITEDIPKMETVRKWLVFKSQKPIQWRDYLDPQKVAGRRMTSEWDQFLIVPKVLRNLAVLNSERANWQRIYEKYSAEAESALRGTIIALGEPISKKFLQEKYALSAHQAAAFIARSEQAGILKKIPDSSAIKKWQQLREQYVPTVDKVIDLVTLTADKPISTKWLQDTYALTQYQAEAFITKLVKNGVLKRAAQKNIDDEPYAVAIDAQGWSNQQGPAAPPGTPVRHPRGAHLDARGVLSETFESGESEVDPTGKTVAVSGTTPPGGMRVGAARVTPPEAFVKTMHEGSTPVPAAKDETDWGDLFNEPKPDSINATQFSKGMDIIRDLGQSGRIFSFAELTQKLPAGANARGMLKALLEKDIIVEDVPQSDTYKFALHGEATIIEFALNNFLALDKDNPIFTAAKYASAFNSSADEADAHLKALEKEGYIKLLPGHTDTYMSVADLKDIVPPQEAGPPAAAANLPDLDAAELEEIRSALREEREKREESEKKVAAAAVEAQPTPPERVEPKAQPARNWLDEHINELYADYIAKCAQQNQNRRPFEAFQKRLYADRSSVVAKYGLRGFTDVVFTVKIKPDGTVGLVARPVKPDDYKSAAPAPEPVDSRKQPSASGESSTGPSVEPRRLTKESVVVRPSAYHSTEDARRAAGEVEEASEDKSQVEKPPHPPKPESAAPAVPPETPTPQKEELPSEAEAAPEPPPADEETAAPKTRAKTPASEADAKTARLPREWLLKGDFPQRLRQKAAEAFSLFAAGRTKISSIEASDTPLPVLQKMFASKLDTIENQIAALEEKVKGHTVQEQTRMFAKDVDKIDELIGELDAAREKQIEPTEKSVIYTFITAISKRGIKWTPNAELIKKMEALGLWRDEVEAAERGEAPDNFAATYAVERLKQFEGSAKGLMLDQFKRGLPAK